MPSWTITTPPTWNANVGNGKTSDYIATAGGWVDATTGELVVAIDNLAARQGASSLVLSTTLATPSQTKYKLGDNFDIIVDFSQNVVVNTGGGNPTISMTIGGSGKLAGYVSGSGTNLLRFRHTIASAENGVVVITSPILLNSGTIKDALNTAHNSSLVFTPPVTTGYTVDSVAPTISGATLAGTVFVTGNPISVTTTFSEAVTVTGVPTIAYTIGGTGKLATYASGTGTTALVFTYVAAAGDHAVATGFTTAATIVLTGGSTIKDPSGNAAVLTFSAPTTTSVTVN